ncbi:hypothetical protein Tco_1327367 [Tanacetum coccineum]
MIQPWERVAKPRITQSFSPETAMSFPPLSEEDGTESPMIIEVEMGGHFVHSKEIKDQMVRALLNLIDLGGETIGPASQIASLLVKLGGTVTLKSSRVIPLECAMISGPSIQPPTAKQVLEEKIKIAIHPEYPEQTVAIGSTLTEKGRKELCALLKQNLDIFAWKPADMTGPSQETSRTKAIQEKSTVVRCWSGILKEVHYHSWLSNPVNGKKKHDGNWANVCGLQRPNNACPKTVLHCREIDWRWNPLWVSFQCFLMLYKGISPDQDGKRG